MQEKVHRGMNWHHANWSPIGMIQMEGRSAFPFFDHGLTAVYLSSSYVGCVLRHRQLQVYSEPAGSQMVSFCWAAVQLPVHLSTFNDKLILSFLFPASFDLN
jgi:hypothetical protein